MNFVSTPFLCFFLVTLVFFWGTQSFLAYRRYIILGANLVFYSFSGVYYVPLLLSIAAIAFAGGKLIASAQSEKKRKFVLWSSIASTLFLLAFFKYYEFFFLSLESLCVLLGGTLQIPLEFAEIAFPIGISFYSFQAISYCVEQYKKPSEPPEPYGRILAYLSFFPTVLAGPIMRPKQFFPQYDILIGKTSGENHHTTDLSGHFPDTISFDKALLYIVSGLFKKVVIASYLSENVVRDIFQAPESYSSVSVLVAVYGYAVQIYCDFSGYTDLAIGIALLLGVQLPSNFLGPYLAVNLQDFWRRWHISLSSWLRDYLYIPLGGSKKGNRYVNLCVTMLLGGLWHGAHVRFLIWGALHGGGLAVVHFIQQACPRWELQKKGMIGRLLAWLLTFHFVCFAWIFFRAEDMERALEIIKRLVFFGFSGEGFAPLALIAIGVGMVSQIIGPRLFDKATHLFSNLPLIAKAVLLGIIVNCIFRMGPDGVMPFIYFQF